MLKLYRTAFLGLSAAEGDALLAPHLGRLLEACLARIAREEEIMGCAFGGEMRGFD